MHDDTQLLIEESQMLRDPYTQVLLDTQPTIKSKKSTIKRFSDNELARALSLARSTDVARIME